MRFQKSLLALTMASTVFLAACGGSDSPSSTSNGGSSGPTARSNVVGPLDAVQQPVSGQVITPLASAVAGTPLAGVVNCVDKVVVSDTLDIVDVLAAQAQNGGANFAGSAAVVQAELTDLLADLQGLVTSLAGGTGCGGATIPAPGGITSNPLAGTPLEAFGATLLSTIASVQGQTGGTPGLSTLSGLIDQLAAGYQQALALVPAEATNAPVVGPSLGLIGQALNDLDTTVTAAATGNPTAVANALTGTVENLLGGLLTDVLPIGALEGATGTGGALTDPLSLGLEQLTAALSGGFAPGNNLTGALPAPVAALLSPLLSPVSSGDPTVVLTTLLGQLTGAIGGGNTGGAVTPISGLPSLDTALATLTNLLDGAGAAQSPLAPLVDTLNGILGILGGGLGGVGGGGGGGGAGGGIGGLLDGLFGGLLGGLLGGGN